MNIDTQPTPNTPSDEPSDKDTKSGIVIDL
jgi:hypothetical protein